MLAPNEQLKIILKGVHQCVDEYHSQKEVEKAMAYYDAAFSKKAVPDNIPSLLTDIDTDTVNDVIPQLIKLESVKSRSEFIRLVRQGGVRINGEKINEHDLNRILVNSDVIKIGKKKFLRAVIKIFPEVLKN